jgi:hypothetical protein
MRSLQGLNRDKGYPESIKPFNFLLSAHVRPFGHPIGADPQRFHLIAPFESNSSKWLRGPWIDAYTGKRHRVTTSQLRGPNIAALMIYGDVLREYEHHEEFKCAGLNSEPCARQTQGLLARRHVRISTVHLIGKESNLLEEAEEGRVHDPRSAYTEYPDARREREAWLRDIAPKLKAMPLKEVQNRTGLSLAALKAVRAGRMPHPRNRELLIRAASESCRNI